MNEFEREITEEKRREDMMSQYRTNEEQPQNVRQEHCVRIHSLMTSVFRDIDVGFEILIGRIEGNDEKRRSGESPPAPQIPLSNFLNGVAEEQIQMFHQRVTEKLQRLNELLF